VGEAREGAAHPRDRPHPNLPAQRRRHAPAGAAQGGARAGRGARDRRAGRGAARRRRWCVWEATPPLAFRSWLAQQAARPLQESAHAICRAAERRGSCPRPLTALQGARCRGSKGLRTSQASPQSPRPPRAPARAARPPRRPGLPGRQRAPRPASRTCGSRRR
jgi:hypothetical protein